jgi:hypothetical protein
MPQWMPSLKELAMPSIPKGKEYDFLKVVSIAQQNRSARAGGNAMFGLEPL